MKRAATLVSSLALVLCAFPAQAQMNSAPAPDGSRIPLFAVACQDAQGRSLPPGSANCVAAQAQAVSGTVTANQGTQNGGGSAAWWVQWANQSVAVSNFPAVQPVSGTVNAAQSGAYTVTQGPAGAQAWKVDGSGVTQPVSAASLPLPANATQETGGNLAALLARTPALGPQTKANSRSVTIATDQGNIGVADPNNAAYSSAGSTFATGATVAAGRAVYLNCSASGSVTMTLSGGGSLAYPVTAGANVLPFAVTAVSADTASCTHQNIN